MTDAKYTPPPWTLGECSNGGMLLIRPALEGQKYAIQSHLQILPVADAVLISQAPALLHALEDFVEWTDYHDQISENCGLCEVRLNAKRIIAAAKGQS